MILSTGLSRMTRRNLPVKEDLSASNNPEYYHTLRTEPLLVQSVHFSGRTWGWVSNEDYDAAVEAVKKAADMMWRIPR